MAIANYGSVLMCKPDHDSPDVYQPNTKGYIKLCFLTRHTHKQEDLYNIVT